jgi:hypothetical protein
VSETWIAREPYFWIDPLRAIVSMVQREPERASEPPGKSEPKSLTSWGSRENHWACKSETGTTKEPNNVIEPGSEREPLSVIEPEKRREPKLGSD